MQDQSTTLSNDPINPDTIDNMTDDELDKLIDQLRERRMKSINVYEAAQAHKREQKREALTATFLKQLEMFKKELATTEKNLEKLAKRALNIRVARMELDG